MVWRARGCCRRRFLLRSACHAVVFTVCVVSRLCLDRSYLHSFHSFTTFLTLLHTPRSLSSSTHSHHDRYQGESNVGAPAPMEGADYYACALPTLIHDWRNNLISPMADKPMPFFVVELSAYVVPLCSTVFHCVTLCSTMLFSKSTWIDHPPPFGHVT
jgi:hypothetical protein